jgi:tricorn protease
MSSVYLYEVFTNRLTKVTEGNYTDYSVAFDLNGKYLYFISFRTLKLVEGMSGFRVETAERIYAMPLAADTTNPLQAPSEEGQNSSSSSANTQTNTEQKVHIDLEGLAVRAFPLPLPAADYTSVFGAKNGVIYGLRTPGTPGLAFSKFDFGSRQSQTLFQGPVSQLSFNPTRTHAAVYGDGKLSVIEVRTGADLSAGKVETSGVATVIDPRQEWRQIFW